MSIFNLNTAPRSTRSLIFKSVFPVLVLVIGSLLLYFFNIQSKIIEKSQDAIKETVTKGSMLLIKNFDLSLRLSEEKIGNILITKSKVLKNAIDKMNSNDRVNYLTKQLQNTEIDWYILSPKLIVKNSSIPTEIGFDLGNVAGESLLACLAETQKTKLPTTGRSSLEKSSNKAKKYVYIALNDGDYLEVGQYLPDTDMIQANLMESINKINKKFPQVIDLQLYYGMDGQGLKRSINKVDFIDQQVRQVSNLALKSNKNLKQKIGSNLHVFNQIVMDQALYNEKWLMHLVFSFQERHNLIWKTFIQFAILSMLTTLLIYLTLKRNLKTYTAPLDRLVQDTEKLMEAEKLGVSQLKHSTDIDVLKYNFNFLFDTLYKNKHELEEKVAKRTEKLAVANSALEVSLKQQEMMFKEVHHRVKNNLQIIASLLNLQSAQLEDNPKAYDAFQESINRVSAIGLFHEKMYKSKQLEVLDLCDFLNELVAFIISGMPTTINYQIKCNHIMVKSDNAVTIALILNELLINSSKHGFPAKNESTVFIELSAANDQTTLIYRDNGKGFAKNFDFKNTDTLGMTIIDAFCEKLDAKYALKNNDDLGMQFSCTFNNPLI